jgi:signal transduction histidine kinase
MIRLIRPSHAVGTLALLAIISILVSTTVLLWNLRNRELSHTYIETLSLTQMLQEQTEQVFSNADFVLRGVQDRLQTAYGQQFDLDSLPVHLLLNARIAGMRQVRSLFLIDTAGNVINSSREHPLLQRLNVVDRPYFQAFVNSKHNALFVGTPVAGRLDGTWTLHLARPILGPQGAFRGVIVISLELAYFEKLYKFAQLDFVRPIALYRDDGILITSLPPRADTIGKPAPELRTIPLAQQDNEVKMLPRRIANDKLVSFSLVRVGSFPILVSVSDDQDDALTSWRETAVPVSIGAGLVVTVIAIVTLLLIAELKREDGLAVALREADERYLRMVEENNRQLQTLSASLQDVREQERTRISRELHDELGQQLTGLKLDLSWLSNRIREGRATELERVDEMRHLLDDTIASVRRISSELRPPILDDLGFCEAVRWLALETEKRSGIAIDLDLPSDTFVSDTPLATAMFRIVQEALTNIVRHAQASQVAIRVALKNAQIVLSISDNGRGFADSEQRHGVGLISMRERVKALGGNFSIISTAGLGVTIEVTAPL